jgi:hypothetical protein
MHIATATESRMGQLLKIAGLLGLMWKLYGDQMTSAVFDRVEYKFSTIRSQHIRQNEQSGEFYGLLRIELLLKQSFGLNLSAQQLTLQLSQQGQNLGKVTVNEPVLLPNATTVPIPVDVIVPAGGFLTRLEDIIKDPEARWQAPIDIQGSLMLSNGIEVPVFASLDFMNL